MTKEQQFLIVEGVKFLYLLQVIIINDGNMNILCSLNKSELHLESLMKEVGKSRLQYSGSNLKTVDFTFDMNIGQVSYVSTNLTIEDRLLVEQWRTWLQDFIDNDNWWRPQENPPRKPFLDELKEYNETGRNCFCGHGKFCDC